MVWFYDGMWCCGLCCCLVLSSSSTEDAQLLLVVDANRNMTEVEVASNAVPGLAGNRLVSEESALEGNTLVFEELALEDSVEVVVNEADEPSRYGQRGTERGGGCRIRIVVADSRLAVLFDVCYSDVQSAGQKKQEDCVC